MKQIIIRTTDAHSAVLLELLHKLKDLPETTVEITDVPDAIQNWHNWKDEKHREWALEYKRRYGRELSD